MFFKAGKLFFVFLLCAFYNLHAVNIKLTSKSIEGNICGEYNRNFGFYPDILAAGELEINNILKARSGVSFARFGNISNLKTFALINAYPFSKIPLDFKLIWNYSGLFEYEVNTHSIIPVISLNWKIAGFSLGYYFSFTSFFGEENIFEAAPVYSIYANFINNKTLRAGLLFGNYNEFGARTIGAYSFNLFGYVRITDNWLLINEIDILQSGGLAGPFFSFYGVSFKTGVRYSW